MSKLIYGAMVSVDGYIAGPGGELDWHVIDEELHTYVNDKVREESAFVYGRRMWEAMAPYWSTADREPGAPAFIVDFARIWQAKPKVVFSRTLDRVTGNARLVRDDLAGELARLKAQPGGDVEIAGAQLAGEAMRLGLVDRYQLYVQPVIVGHGIPMFPDADVTRRLGLVETHRFGSGVVLLEYEVR